MKDGRWYWPPRVLAIMYVVFISLFALDVFSEGYSLLELVMAWTMHMIPSFVLVAITIVAWRWERVGAILFLGAALLLTFVVIVNNAPSALMVVGPLIVGPLVLIAALFLHHSLRQKQSGLRA